MKLLAFLACLFATFVGAAIVVSSTLETPAAPELRILFVGNSYTFVNDLPGTLVQLAASGGHPIAVNSAVAGGWSLGAHLSSAATLEKINAARWDYVVLQEQSQIPASPGARGAGMYPAARQLAEAARKQGATPMFFVTWGHRDGWPDGGLNSYDAMQTEINRGYIQIAREVHGRAAPVGPAWARVRAAHPEIELWQADGSHPTEAGTYLAACVFYAALLDEAPTGLAFHGNLDAETAEQLQAAATSPRTRPRTPPLAPAPRGDL